MAPLIPLVSVDSTLGLALIGFAGSCVSVPSFLFTVDIYLLSISDYTVYCAPKYICTSKDFLTTALHIEL